MPITPKILDEILKDYEKPEDLLSQDGLWQQLTKALIERALSGEMSFLKFGRAVCIRLFLQANGLNNHLTHRSRFNKNS